MYATPSQKKKRLKTYWKLAAQRKQTSKTPIAGTDLLIIAEEAEMLAGNDDEIDDTLSNKLVSDPIIIFEILFSNMPWRQLVKVHASVDINIKNHFTNHSEIEITFSFFLAFSQLDASIAWNILLK